MKDFTSKDLHYNDIKAVRLYQARQSVMDRLCHLGSKRNQENGAIATEGLVEMIKLSLLDAASSETLLPEGIENHIIEHFQKFNELIASRASLDSGS